MAPFKPPLQSHDGSHCLEPVSLGLVVEVGYAFSLA